MILLEVKVHQIHYSFGKNNRNCKQKSYIKSFNECDIENAQEILKRKIEDIYLPEILTAEPESDVRKVVQIMLDLKLDAIPIVDENDIDGYCF